MGFDLSSYELVEDRIRAFWAEYPNGRLLSDKPNLVLRDDGKYQWECMSYLYVDKEDPRPTTTGFASEIEGSTNVNKYSAAENCETSSLGRALANFKFAAKGKRASESEMKKVQRMTSEENSPKNYEDVEPIFKALELCATKDELDAVRNKITAHKAQISPNDLSSLRNLYDAREALIAAAG